jgi:hypothetical protein
MWPRSLIAVANVETAPGTAIRVGSPSSYRNARRVTKVPSALAKNGVLLLANSTTGKLFRVDPATGIADRLDLGGADLSYPDGLELLGHKLYVVRPFDNRVTLISLRAGLTSGVVLGHLTDPSLDIPSTATVAAGRLWAVNLRFTTPVTPDTLY